MHQALIGPRVHCCFIFNTLFLNFPMERADAFKTPTMPRARRVSVCVFLYTYLSRHSAVPAFADLEADTKLWPPLRFPDYFQESSRVSGQKWGSCVLPARIINKYCPRAALERRVAGKSSGAASFTSCHWVNWDLFASWMLRPVSGASRWK